MIHIALHFLVPLLVAAVVYRRRWGYVFLVLIATMAVDLDHLLADPIYDPDRCSIGFHPLHRAPAIVMYGMMVLAPWVGRGFSRWKRALDAVHLVGVGLVIHMVLDGLDCWM
ncbi:MAG: hypothetical protein JJ896_14220 [Rhodothermales bacterium]|nr:hypothetical protein [Rhodothermales bacterium]MBO6780805.1 hypothetical protein [Rhodothermales bacterium]